MTRERDALRERLADALVRLDNPASKLEWLEPWMQESYLRRVDHALMPSIDAEVARTCAEALDRAEHWEGRYQGLQNRIATVLDTADQRAVMGLAVVSEETR